MWYANPGDTERALKEWSRGMDQFAQGMTAAIPVSEQAGTALHDLAHAFKRIARQRYRDLGSPYGESEADLDRWLADTPHWLEQAVGNEQHWPRGLVI